MKPMIIKRDASWDGWLGAWLWRATRRLPWLLVGVAVVAVGAYAAGWSNWPERVFVSLD